MTEPIPAAGLPAAHWLTRFGPDDGEPYGEVCSCGIGADHDGAGHRMFTDDEDDQEEDRRE